MPKTPIEYENFSNEFQIRISEIIDDLGLNQKEFAELVHVSQPVINRATKYGIYPTTKILIRIADNLKLPILYLIGKSNDNQIVLAEKYSSFHKRLEELREERRVSYSQIALSMTFSENYFSEWKRLKTMPSIVFVIEIANYFCVSIDYLLGRTDYKN